MNINNVKFLYILKVIKEIFCFVEDMGKERVNILREIINILFFEEIYFVVVVVGNSNKIGKWVF